jgi:hypothetical protein
VLLSPSETDAAPSSLFQKTEALKTPLPLPPPPYKRRREPHNPSLLLFPVLLWVSLVQELALIGAQVIAATTLHRPGRIFRSATPSYGRRGPKEPLFLLKHPR